MADTVMTRILRNTTSEAAILICGVSDGTGETKVAKADISALTMGATKVQVKRLVWACEGLTVLLYFDRSTDDLFAILAARGTLDEEDDDSISDNVGTGDTGDILLSTVGFTAGDGYTVYIELRKIA